jgi:hypothetical protein
MEDMGDFVTDFHLSVEPMAALGWQVETVPWRSRVDWDEFDAVYICTPWDYPDYLPQFLDVLVRRIGRIKPLILDFPLYPQLAHRPRDRLWVGIST